MTNNPNVFVYSSCINDPEDWGEYATIAEASQAYGFSEGTIRQCCEGHMESIGGYRFEFRGGDPKQPGNHYVPVENASNVFVRRTGGLYGEDPVDYNSVAEAAAANGVSEGCVSQCCEGAMDSIRGYSFEFCTDPDEPATLVCAVTGVKYLKADGDVYACVDDLEECVGSPEIHDGLYLGDIGKTPIAPTKPRTLIEPDSRIESMRTRKVRRIASGVVYANCHHAADAIEVEAWRIHAACTHGHKVCATGDFYVWADDSDDSDDSDKSDRPESYDDCPWFW